MQRVVNHSSQSKLLASASTIDHSSLTQAPRRVFNQLTVRVVEPTRCQQGVATATIWD